MLAHLYRMDSGVILPLQSIACTTELVGLGRDTRDVNFSGASWEGMSMSRLVKGLEVRKKGRDTATSGVIGG